MADIVAACAANWPRHRSDCSGFCRAVAASLAIPLQGLANQIVDTIRGGGGWTVLPDGPAAAAQAAAGKFVIAGMKGTEQRSPSPNGHVVVVVPGPLAQGKYPTAWWGQLGGSGAQNQTLNYSWTAGDRDRITYSVWDATTTNPRAPEPATEDSAANAPNAPRAPGGQTFPVYNQVVTVSPRTGRVSSPPTTTVESSLSITTGFPPLPPFTPSGAYAVARVGDQVTHGQGPDGQIISGSDTRVGEGRPVARIGDIVLCREHGIVQIISVVGDEPVTDTRSTAHVSAICSCGARVITGADTISQGPR